jgi:hypothetical protein
MIPLRKKQVLLSHDEVQLALVGHGCLNMTKPPVLSIALDQKLTCEVVPIIVNGFRLCEQYV